MAIWLVMMDEKETLTDPPYRYLVVEHQADAPESARRLAHNHEDLSGHPPGNEFCPVCAEYTRVEFSRASLDEATENFREPNETAQDFIARSDVFFIDQQS